ncbi:hypothetical protein QFC20_001753 [Naganishia adeliensis]|uniref:Uncharacterized protein n=1 Tax=Naganishia adeliensis TaxID=92952 RepID=A0ACC2WQH1_9TREE|nr:hypothetical protein QFC20_001753 [Naganishia adeliensis]
MSQHAVHLTYTLDVDAHTLILQEIQTLTAFIRRSPRWAAAPQSAYSSTYYSVVVGPKLATASAKENEGSESAASRTHSRTSSLVTQKAQQQSQPPIANTAPPSSNQCETNARGIESEEMDLLAGFVGLKRTLAQVKDFTEIPPAEIVRPFLDLIRSPLTSGPITSLALTSLNTLILHILPCYQEFPLPPLTSTSFTLATTPTPLQLALTHVTSTIARCRFPSTNPAQDEVVLLRLLKVTESLVTGHLERDLNDEGVCEILEVGLGMGGRARLGEGLRRTAQTTVGAIVKAGFGRLKLMDPRIVLGENSQINSLLSEEKTIGTRGGDAAVDESGTEASVNDESSSQVVTLNGDEAEPVPKSSSGSVQPVGAGLTESTSAVSPFTPYGLPTLLELLRVLISLLNPQDLTHTDSMRLSALGVLNSALEAGGRHLGDWPELVDGLKDEGCRYLFQLIRSENHQILTIALRTCATLFTTLLPQLKLQLELFLTFLMDRLTPPTHPALPPYLLHIRNGGGSSAISRSRRGSDKGTAASSGGADGASTDRPTTPKLSATPTAASLASVATVTTAETREIMLETLTQLLQMRNEHFMVDLWVNYDCDVDSEDVFERMIAFLTRGVYSNTSTIQSGPNSMEGLDNSQMICFEAVLDFVDGMSTRRANRNSQRWPEYAPSIERLRRQKDRKALLITGAQAFNAKPKKGIAYLQEHSLIDGFKPGNDDDPDNVKALAVFLRSNGRLDKKLLGEYISNPDRLNLLKAYIGLFDFKGKSIADAMRELLEAFRLPGEAQPIARITEVFAEHYISFNPVEIKNSDAAYVLAYSVIMLNTDQHNPQNRRRMTIEDYQRNLRGVNGGEDFPPEYLAAIHDSIRKNEIIMPQEHVGQAGFDYAWKGLIQRSKAAGKTITTDIADFDREMFKISWQSVVEAIASAFSAGAQDEYVIQGAIKGFRQCATLGGEFDLPEVIDSIVLSLSFATGLLDDTDDGYQSTNHPVVNTENGEVTVSPLSIRFGNNFRGQLATVVLFTIAHGNGNAIQEGWGQIFEMFQTLFIHSLLPAKLSQEVDFLSGNSAIPLKLNNPGPIREERRTETGLLSTLSSYLLSPYGSAGETVSIPSQDDVEYTLSALDCLASCKLEEFYQDLHHLSQDSLIAALRALRSLAETRSGPKHRDYASLRTRDDLAGRSATPAYDEAQQPYDPATVLDLELMVELASSKPEYAAETWPIVFDFIAALLSSAQLYSVLLTERAVTGLLRLCLLICDQPNLRDQLYIALDALRSLPATALNAVSEQLMSGIAKILEKERTVVKSQTEWGLITALFRATVAHPEASKVTLELVQKTTSGAVGSGLTADNYQGMVAILDEFATAAGAAAMRIQHPRRGTAQPVAPTLGPTVERGIAALDSLYELRNVIPSLMESSSLSKVDAWNTFWLPPLMAVAKHCVTGSRDIRRKAVGYLQRLLLSQQLMSSEQAALSAVFARVLLPILEELLKPQVFDRDPAGMEETRLRAATLLCKVFLQYLMLLGESKETVANLLTRVIDLLERFMRTGSRQLYEAVPESLKNVLLVMQSSGLLAPPTTPDTRTEKQKLLWSTAYNRIERFLPGFLNEVIPTPAPTVMPVEATEPPADVVPEKQEAIEADEAAPAAAAPAEA